MKKVGDKLNTQKLKVCDAQVIALLPNAQFKLMLLPNGKIIIGSMAGRLYKHKIRIILGDKVQVDSKCRIIYRYL
ncbi:translation initiation factor IF-1 [Candidatus Phytoplasma oryzae]|nr:translation initiation factor IF-1 [Candidatus Phytoplasma oryzae]